MAKSDRTGTSQQEALGDRLEIIYVPIEDIYPNPWNVNEMDQEMFEKERASIRRHGFVDPCTVRTHPWEQGKWQLIDGEHRLRAARQEGLTELPIVIKEVDDDEAQELSIILNETRGKADSRKLADLVKSLSERRDQLELSEVLPFSRERFEQMLGEREVVDYAQIEDMGPQEPAKAEVYVERVYRMPREVALVVDEAISKIQGEHQLDQDWRALEVMAAEAMAS